MADNISWHVKDTSEHIKLQVKLALIKLIYFNFFILWPSSWTSQLTPWGKSTISSVLGSLAKQKKHCHSFHTIFCTEALICKLIIPDSQSKLLIILSMSLKSRLFSYTDETVSSVRSCSHTTSTVHRTEMAISRVGASKVV